MDNGHVESFNGKLRDESLNAHWFRSVDEARRVINHWRNDYNDVRPHSALGGAAPTMCAQQHHRLALPGV